MREPGRDGKIARPPSPCTEPHRRPNDHARLIVLVLRMDFIQHITTALQRRYNRAVNAKWQLQKNMQPTQLPEETGEVDVYTCGA